MSDQQNMFENVPDECQRPREAVNLRDLPPTSVQQGGSVKVWLFDSPDDLPASMRHRVNFSEWPNDAAVSSLSQILETGQIPQRFFLSKMACAGILRRAEKRGKNIPGKLKAAMISGAAAGD